MIFDLDGTLLNTIGDLAAAANHTLAEMGFAPHTEEEYKYMVGNGIPKLIERFLPPGHRDEATQAQAARLFSLITTRTRRTLRLRIPASPPCLPRCTAQA